MLKRYYQLNEAADFLSAEHKQPISKRDVLEMAVRGELRLCAWIDGTLCAFCDLDPFEPPRPAPTQGGPYQFRGYIQIPRWTISPSGGVVTLNALECFDLLDSPLGDQMPGIPRFPYIYGLYNCNPDTGDVIHTPLSVNIDDALVPAVDLIERRKSLAETGAPTREVKPLATTERNTLLTIIAALCDYSAIKIDERGAASQIAKLTEELGAAVSQDTVLRVLVKINDALESRKK